MSLDKGTLVTHYAYEDETETFGHRTCKGYDVEDRDDVDYRDICVGMALIVNHEGILVKWIQMCSIHVREHTPVGYFDNGELWEIGQLA